MEFHKEFCVIYLGVILLALLSIPLPPLGRLQPLILVPKNTMVPTNINLIPTPTPTHPTNVTSSPTPNVSQQDILAVYKDLIQSNKDTMDAAHTTLNVIMTLVSLATTIMVGAGIFSIIKIQGVVQKATHAEKIVYDLEEKINNDTRVLDQLHTRHTVDQYAMRLFSCNPKENVGAKKELLQLSKHLDPIIRRECLRVFGAMPNLIENWWDENVYRRITEMAKGDSEGGVRCEAQYTEQIWTKKRNEGK